jgi:hypothetical protein
MGTGGVGMIADGSTSNDLRGAAQGYRRNAVSFFLALLTLAAVALGASAAGPAGAAPPAPALKTPAVAGVSAATASFTVSWSATPATGGVTWDVQYREVVAGTPTDADWRWLAHGTTLTQKQAKGEPGHTYTLRARTLQDGTPGAWSAGLTTVVPYDQEAGALFTAKYSSGWRSARASAAYLGSMRYASTKGRTATFTFTGRAVSLLAPKGRAKGKLQVKVRTGTGGAWSTVKTLDLYSATTKKRSLMALKTWATTAARQVQLRVTGAKNRRSKSTRVDLDGIVVRDAPHTAEPVVVALTPTQPTIGFEEQQQFTAEVRHSLDQTVDWHCFRIGNSGDVRLIDGAGSITGAGLYTSTDVPSQATPGNGPIRRYFVEAINANGTYNTEVTVVPGPAPQITGLSSTSGAEGATITISGTGLVNHSWQPEVSFSGRAATIVGTPTATQVSVQVPRGWYSSGTAAGCYVGVTTCGQASNRVDFTVTGLQSSSLELLSVAMADGMYGTTNASPGDTISVYGIGFSHTAAENVFDFGGQTATATSWTYGSPYERVTVTIPAAAPVGTTTLRACPGAAAAWSSLNFTLVAKTVVTLDASSFPHGVIDTAGVNHFASPNTADTWILRGSGFNSLRLGSYLPAGTFTVEITAGGQTWTVEAKELSDTVALCPAGSDSLWDAVGAGDSVSVRASGIELTNHWTRTSGSLTVPVTADAVYGGTHSVMVPFTTHTLELSKGDLLRLECAATSTHGLTAPGFWTGTLPMRQYAGQPYTPDCADKLIRFPTAGTYTVSDGTAGTVLTVVVKEGGAVDAQSLPMTSPWTGWWTEDLVMAGGGARLTIPAGALVPEANYPGYAITISKTSNTVRGYDPTLGDFGGQFHISLAAKHLYHPITVQLPYDPAGRYGAPGFCLYDSASGVYYQLGATVDSTAHTVTYTIPAGAYPEAMSAGKSGPAATRPQPATARGADPWTGDQSLPDMPLNRILDSTAVVSSTVLPGLLTDDVRQLRVEYCADPASSSFVSAAYADEVLTVAQRTCDNLDGHGWSPPSGWVVIHLRDFGPISPSHAIGTQGATTKAVFGQPYVYVNSHCTAGAQLDTAVSHEIGHVYERQLTTNISVKWIDEAVAEWVAYDTLGAGADLRAGIEQGNDFAGLQLPTGFYFGYSTEQAYAAGAFVIWMARQYGPAAVLSIYDQLAYHPANWDSSYSVLATATNATMADLASGFGSAYWKQEYAPVTGITLASGPVIKLTADWKGVAATATRPPYSSSRVSVSATDDFKTTLKGSDLYVSATGLGADQTIEIYGDAATVASPPGASLIKIATLTAAAPDKFIGTFGTSYGYYRCIVLNRSASAAPTIGLTVEPVHVDTVLPLTAPAAGGGSVTLSGRGFGRVKGSVTVGSVTVQDLAISAWSDTSITFTLPNMTGQTGPQDVVAHPAAGVKSNTRTLTLY